MYKIKLPNFEGPFDLLLFFIRRDEINIYDIPIAKIAREFLNYINIMKMFDLELAGEFLVMAANLMYIKTQLLLPRESDSNDDEPEDPRTQLVQRLLEYKQFKEAGIELETSYEDQRYTLYKSNFDAEYNQASKEAGYKNASLFDLIKAFQNVFDRLKENSYEHIVEIIPVTVDEKKDEIITLLQKKKRISFFDITTSLTNAHVVASFLAILDLVKVNKIYIYQDSSFEDIIIADPQSMEFENE